MYLGAASGTTVSHVSDIVGPVSFYELKSKWSHSHVHKQNRKVEAFMNSTLGKFKCKRRKIT